MFWVLGTMVAGICMGYLFRNYRKLFFHIGRLNMWIIYLLLFAMGLSVGSNDAVMDNLGGLGLRAIGIAMAGIAGSVLLSWLLYKYFFVSGEERK